MPVIPFFPNFPRFVNTGGRRRRRRDYQSQYNNLRSTNSQGLELLGSTCQSQASTPAPLSAGQYLPQQYSQQNPQTPQLQYSGSQYAPSQYTQSQPASPFAPMQQRPMSAPQQGGQDPFMLPSLQQSSLGATSGYQLPSQPAISSSLYQPIQTTSVYQPPLVTPIVPSSSNYLPYSSSGHGHSHSLSLTSNPSIYDQKSNPRTLPQPMSAGRALSTLGAIPPSGLSFFGMTPAQQAFFQQRKLPPPPPPQPRVYSFENSTQTTIAETLAISKENKEKRANSPRQRSEGPTSYPTGQAIVSPA
ncbi:hypothetical protein ABW19_dt0208156 [Dactylella cylindrospora]|nr:hypothetical protein ABW19_dt0208156 [Dactylella cylindrospora]